MIKRIWKNKAFLLYIVKTIYFNFHYLPFMQAIKLPILLYKPHLKKCKGKIIIKGKIKPGMIRIGIYRTILYPNSGFIFSNDGGTIIFEGKTDIGNGTVLEIGKNSILRFGNNFSATANLKLVCFNKIEFGDNVTIGWDNLFMDTDFHKMCLINGTFTKGYGKIKIGNNNWFSNQCLITKNTETNDFQTFAARSLLCKKYETPLYSVLGGNPIKIISTNKYLDINNHVINYEHS